MWAQLIHVRLKPGSDVQALAEVLKSAEQPDSGLVREFFLHDQTDPGSVYVLAVFESEEKAREREADPRRAAGQQAIQEWMTQVLASPPEFTNLVVAAEWVP